MGFIIRHRLGDEDDQPDLSVLEALLDELDSADEEHVSVSIQDDSGWTLSVYVSGGVTWENVEDDPVRPRHMEGLPRSGALELARAVAAGDLDGVEREPWLPGYW